MKLFEIVYEPGKDAGVYALGCVEDPAMEDMWMTLSEHPKEIQFSAVDEERKILLGAALIPNKRIYRKVKDKEFYVMFKEDTISKLAHDFFKNGYQNNSSENHQFKIDGCTAVESWIVEDPENDKSNLFGKKYEKGTWVVMMKVENDDTWKKAKEGKLNGFSIEAYFGLKELDTNNLNMEKDKEKKTIPEQIAEGFDALMKKMNLSPVEMKRLKLKDGAEVEFEGDKPEIGKPIFGLSSDKKEKFKLPKGTFELESGEKLHVDENSLVAEEPKAKVEEPKKEGEMVAELMSQMAGTLSAMDKKWEGKFSQMEAAFNLKLATEKSKNEELEAKLEKIPADEKITKDKIELNQDAKVAETAHGRILAELSKLN